MQHSQLCHRVGTPVLSVCRLGVNGFITCGRVKLQLGLSEFGFAHLVIASICKQLGLPILPFIVFQNPRKAAAFVLKCLDYRRFEASDLLPYATRETLEELGLVGYQIDTFS